MLLTLERMVTLAEDKKTLGTCQKLWECCGMCVYCCVVVLVYCGSCHEHCSWWCCCCTPALTHQYVCGERVNTLFLCAFWCSRALHTPRSPPILSMPILLLPAHPMKYTSVHPVHLSPPQSTQSTQSTRSLPVHPQSTSTPQVHLSTHVHPVHPEGGLVHPKKVENQGDAGVDSEAQG